MDIKTFIAKDIEFDDDTGTVKAVIATLDVIDKDGDVTLPGFFGTQPTAIANAHDRSRVGGKGVITDTTGTAMFEGQYFLETIEGKQQYLTAKAMGDLQEWSYGFHILNGGSELGTHDGKSVRFLKAQPDGTPGVRVAEVSTVLVGAGEGTHTVGIKQHGLRFVEQAEQVAQAVELLLSRAEEIKEMRAVKGNVLGDEAVARLRDVKTRLASAAVMFGDLTDPILVPDAVLPMFDVQRNLANAQALVERI